MFPNSSSSFNSFSYSYPPMFKEPNTNEENPNSTTTYNPSFFFPSSNSLVIGGPKNSSNIQETTTHFNVISQSTLENNIDHNLHNMTKNKEKPLRTKQKRKSNDGKNPNIPSKNPRKKTGKSDRHSKIFTEKGPRDRRMRLSVPIARKFFDLQDILGFDKASKTIEWLFCQSKDSIEELVANLSNSCGNNNLESNVFKLGDKNDELGKVVQVSQANKYYSKANNNKARERTNIGSSDQGNPKIFEEELAGPFIISHEQHDQENHFLLDEDHQVGTNIENFVGATSSSASNSIFDFHDKDFSMSGGVDSRNSLMGIFDNWDYLMVPWTGEVSLYLDEFLIELY